MIIAARLRSLLALVALLLPGWAGVEASAGAGDRMALAPLQALAADDLIQPRGPRQPASAGVDRDAPGTDGTHAPAAAAPATRVVRRHALDGVVIPVDPTRCRPHAERLPYHPNAPPAA